MTGVLYASGEGWVGSGVRSVESGLHSLFAQARRRLVCSAYSISGGAFDLPAQWIGEALGRGVSVVLLVNRYAGQHRSGVGPIGALARDCELLELWDYHGPPGHDLHAKAVVCDERLAFIGSSNLSGGGLLRNHELAVMVEGEPARLAADLIVQLTRSSYARRLR